MDRVRWKARNLKTELEGNQREARGRELELVAL